MKINTFEVDWNKEALFKNYEVYCLTTCRKYIKSGARILDLVEVDKQVKAVKFERGNKMYVLLPSNNEAGRNLLRALGNMEGGEEYSCVQVRDVEDHILISLLFNALASCDSPLLRVNNLTGHLYCVRPKWIKNKCEQFTALELLVHKDLNFDLNVATFTAETKRSSMVFKKRKFEEYPKYILQGKGMLRRKLDTDKQVGYLKKQFKKKKSSIPFLDMASLDVFSNTKMGVLHDLLVQFNTKYEGLAHLRLQEVDESACALSTCATHRASNKVIQARLKQEDLILIDRIHTETSMECLEHLQEMLRTLYGLPATITSETKPDALNIELVHKKEYYEDMDDPYEQNSGNAVQHITLEDCKIDKKSVLHSVLHEVLIKKDLQEGKITLFDWNNTGYTQPVVFGLKLEDEEKGNRYFFMDVNPDGTFAFREEEEDPFTMNTMIETLSNPGTRGVVCVRDGVQLVIHDTGNFMIPEIDSLYAHLEQGNTKIRGKEKREELFASCIDVRMFEKEGKVYYFVGVQGQGVKYSIPRASCIRYVSAENGTRADVERLLPLMNVHFVRNDQLTVIPFPFKYVLEYARKSVRLQTEE